MCPHYTSIVIANCLGSDWVEQAVEVSQVGYGERFVVEVEVEALKQEVGLFEASTLVRSCPTMEVEEDTAVKEG